MPGPTAFIRRVINQLGRKKKERDQKQDSPVSEKNNCRRDFMCLPRFDGRSLTKRNPLVKAKSEEQGSAKRGLLVRACSVDQTNFVRNFIVRSGSVEPSPKASNALCNSASETQSSQTTQSKVENDGQNAVINNDLSEPGRGEQSAKSKTLVRANSERGKSTKNVLVRANSDGKKNKITNLVSENKTASKSVMSLLPS